MEGHRKRSTTRKKPKERNIWKRLEKLNLEEIERKHNEDVTKKNKRYK